MSSHPGPILDNELLYRRIPEVYFQKSDDRPSPEAFRPTDDDTSGLSVSREKYTSIEKVAKGRPGKSYYVAVLRAGDLREYGIVVDPSPTDHDPGHAHLPDMRSDNRRDKRVLELKVLLAETLCLRVEGPFCAEPS